MSYHLKRSDDSVRDGVRRIAISQIDRAIAEINDGDLDVHDTVHQARKRCKKLRGLVRLVRPAFDGYKAENALFRDAAAQLSYIRDAEAMIETHDYLVKVYDNAIDREAFKSIRRRLTDRKKRIAGEKGLNDKLSAYRSAMVDARGRVEDWALDTDGFDAIGDGVAKTYGRAKKAIARAREEPTAGNLHEFRKRVKYHRYHANLLRSIWPDLVLPHQDAADRLGDMLGDHHNLSVFKATVLDNPEAFGEPADVEAFVGLIEQRQAVLAADSFAIGFRLFAEKASALRRRWRVYWRVWQNEQSLRQEVATV